MDMTGYGELDERIVAPNASHLEEQSEFTLRPQTLDEYIGQQTATDNLKVFIEAASTYNYPDETATAVCYYLDKREVSNLPPYMDYTSAQMKTNITSVPIIYKADTYARSFTMTSYPRQLCGSGSQKG